MCRSALRSNLINPKTGHRIRMVALDTETNDEVQRRDLVKGYEFRKDQYLLLTDQGFDSVKVESSSVLNIEKFVEVGAIDPIYYSGSYYLAPDGDAGHDVYAVLHQAIAETGRIALARVVIVPQQKIQLQQQSRAPFDHLPTVARRAELCPRFVMGSSDRASNASAVMFDHDTSMNCYPDGADDRGTSVHQSDPVGLHGVGSRCTYLEPTPTRCLAGPEGPPTRRRALSRAQQEG